MQVSLGGRPHRADRSQSPQVKSDTRRIVATLLVGEDTADSPGRAHLFLLCTKIIVRSSPGCIDPDQHGGNPGQCDPRIAVAVRDKVRATLVFA